MWLINLKSLVVEITRQCNMQCEHCMRGDPEPVDFYCSLSERLCSQLKHIDALTLTGGEPSLAVKEIKYLLHYLKNYQVTVGGFFVSTNACEYSAEFLEVLDELYDYCEKPLLCGLSISMDQFHSPPSPEAVSKYKEKQYYNPCKEKGTIPPYAILREGRAQKDEIGRIESLPSNYIYDYDIQGIYFGINDIIYINACGDVLLDSDLSYRSQKHHSLGNIKDNNLIAILSAALFDYSNFQKGYVYTLNIDSDNGLIASFLSKRIFKSCQKAAAGFKNIRNNLIFYKTGLTKTEFPDDLIMDIKEIQRPSPDFLIGTTISFSSVDEGYIGNVTLTLTQTKLADGDDIDAG